VILEHLGASREVETPVEKVIEQCDLAKLDGDWRLSDYDPLVVVMDLVTEEVRGLGLSPKGPKGSAVWIESMEHLQAPNALVGIEHNRFAPCRTCDKSFRPAIDRHVLKLFLTWQATGRVEDLLAIHRCQRCGGTITELEVKPYEGDWHTPEPGTVADDREWAREFLSHSGLFDRYERT
jgi:hypothetical protein